jgi:hypothetical protein
MARASALTLGLNAVDPGHYQGWSGDLVACEADASDMSAILSSRGFAVKRLLTKEATRGNVSALIGAAARALQPGDIFALTYSGHGGQLPDLDGEEDDGLDETWCLFDGQLVDDEIYAALGAFAKGVRILVFSDSCHSGTAVKVAYYTSGGASPASRAAAGLTGTEAPARFRAMPHEVALRTYEANRDFYDPILTDEKIAAAARSVAGSVLLISGCQDNQLSADGPFNGLFTGTLRRVWNGGKFSGDYRAFHEAIVKRMPPDQSPNYFTVGSPNPAFESEQPFKV